MFKSPLLVNYREIMTSRDSIAVLGVDWGTTHRRAYALDGAGVLVREFEDKDGALACKDRFPLALDALVQQMNVNPGLIVMSGMVGSALGWHEVPYLGSGTALNDISSNVFLVPQAGAGPARVIVPGYCVRNAWGQPDVMRGEETQLLGAVRQGHHSGWFVLPGTHSKWVELKDGCVVQLRTYMTGELYDLLGQHGTVAAAIGKGKPVWDAAAFADGVESASRGGLGHQLFGCRARVVCGDMPAASTKSYLSGLLIGGELMDVLRDPRAGASTDTFKLLGSPELATHYLSAAQQLNMTLDILDVKAAFLAAVADIHATWKAP
jgi:2-dehydro-3-deoxygalactonokinase